MIELFPGGLCGNPYHGKVYGGQITLPNGETMPVQQPAAWSYGIPYNSGLSVSYNDGYPSNRIRGTSHHKIVVPGTAPIDLTPDEVASELQEGRKWLDYFIMSGGSVYGKKVGNDIPIQYGASAVGGWIYADDDGVRWLCKLSGTTLNTATDNLTTTLTMTRFGEWVMDGNAADIKTHVLVIPGCGQTEPIIGSWMFFEGDVTRNGNKALLYIVNDSPINAAPVPWRGVFGIVEISISSPEVVSAAVIKTRTQMFGVGELIENTGSNDPPLCGAHGCFPAGGTTTREFRYSPTTVWAFYHPLTQLVIFVTFEYRQRSTFTSSVTAYSLVFWDKVLSSTGSGHVDVEIIVRVGDYPAETITTSADLVLQKGEDIGAVSGQRVDISISTSGVAHATGYQNNNTLSIDPFSIILLNLLYSEINPHDESWTVPPLVNLVGSAPRIVFSKAWANIPSDERDAFFVYSFRPAANNAVVLCQSNLHASTDRKKYHAWVLTPFGINKAAENWDVRTGAEPYTYYAVHPDTGEVFRANLPVAFV